MADLIRSTPMYVEQMTSPPQAERGRPGTHQQSPENVQKMLPPFKDDHGEELEGTFYQKEVQKVGNKEVYRIETVLKHRRAVGGQREYLVKRFGYDPTFNSWIPAKLLQQYSG